MAHESAKTYAVNSKLPDHITWVKINTQFNNGIADCYYHHKDKGLWIEYKSESSLGRKVNVSKLQERWLIQTNGWVIMLTDKGHGIYTSPDQWQTKAPSKRFKTYREVAEYITTYMETN